MTAVRLAYAREADKGRSEALLMALDPTLRLAVPMGQSGAVSPSQVERAVTPPPDVRLALGNRQGAEWLGNAQAHPAGEPAGAVTGEEAPTVRMATQASSQGTNALKGARGVERIPPESRPALLVSYVYLGPFLEHKHRFLYRDWALDSGAFSAHHSGETIDVDAYADVALRLLEEDPTLVEVFSLDVIGDWRQGLRNAEHLATRGLEAIPTYHYGEPEHVLLTMAREHPKIALGGVARLRPAQRRKWLGQVFARVWPKKIHGFGISDEATLLAYPFHSVDATSWEFGPCAYGQWRSYGRQRVSVRGSKQNLRVEVEHYLGIERRIRRRWRREMEVLEADDHSPRTRLAWNSHPSVPKAVEAPSARLALNQSLGSRDVAGALGDAGDEEG